MDKVFDDPDYKDPYYLNRRQNTIIVSLACNHPLKTCFCSTLGGQPHGEQGADCKAVKLSCGYLLKPLTEKGTQLMASLDAYADAQDADV